MTVGGIYIAEHCEGAHFSDPRRVEGYYDHPVAMEPISLEEIKNEKLFNWTVIPIAKNYNFFL